LWLQVRIAAAVLVPPVAKVLGGDAARQDLLPELSELLVDEEVQVRTAEHATHLQWIYM
jgi:hypothetical protein